MLKKKCADNEGGKTPASRNISPAGYVIPVLLILFLIGYIFFQQLQTDDLYLSYKMTMDTMVELRFSESSAKPGSQIEEEVLNEIERLEMLFSRSIDTSDVSRINAAAGKTPVQVSDEVLYVTGRAVKYAEVSDGKFDPTVGPLVDLWGFLGQEYRVPSAAEVENVLPLVDYNLVEIAPEQSAVYLTQENMVLELGGVAKGYIVDRALEILNASGVEHAFINAGGDIGLIGSNPDGDPWRIGGTHPREHGEIIAVISASGGSVVTSGDYQRSFEEDGIKYHHILDPDTGLPARKLASVTIIAETATEADALSTAVFVLGPDKGLDLIEKLPTAEGILITPEIEILVSSGLEGLVELNP